MRSTNHPQHPQRAGTYRVRRKPGPRFSAFWLALIGLDWMALIFLGLYRFRPWPLNAVDLGFAVLAVLIAIFYFIVAYGVYTCRKAALNPAFICAAVGLLSFPVGTFLALIVLGELMARKHDFTR